MAVKIDIIDGNTVRQTADGIEAVRIATVSGLTGDPSAISYNALLATPAIGDTHPTISGIRVVEKAAKPQSFNRCSVDIIYRTPQLTSNPGDPQIGDPTRISIGASLQTATTERESDGTVMQVTYTPSEEEMVNKEFLDGEGNEWTAASLYPDDIPEFTITPAAEVQLPQMFLRITRRENQSPGDLAQRFVGKINRATFLGAPAKFWLCTQINGESNDGGLTYIVTYEFLRSSNSDVGWDFVAIAEKDGKRMVDATFDNDGLGTFQIYPDDNFDDIGL